jgi:hypothetical protein
METKDRELLKFRMKEAIQGFVVELPLQDANTSIALIHEAENDLTDALMALVDPLISASASSNTTSTATE